MSKAEEFFKANYFLEDDNVITFEVMEAYHISRINAISDNTQKAIDEFTRLQAKYPRMATVDVVKMLKRLIQDLKKLKL